MADANIWGAGGLFERAMEAKIANQKADAARTQSQVGVDRMNADTGLLDAKNKYDLGLRGNAVDMQNADTNRMNAGTNAYNAESNRVATSSTEPISAATANMLGLRSYNPASQDAIARFESNRSNSMLNSTLRNTPAATGYMANSPAATATAPTTPAATPVDLTRARNSMKMVNGVPTYGFKNGGKVKSMKAMAGYGKGGKVKTMIGCENGGQVEAMGYAKSGKIGDVDNDTGEDTIPAKVRPGEYMLNPETVAHIGGGNYDQGVRHLNQIVRQATGKEPGPTLLKKGEAGFAKSGEASRWQRFKDTAADWTTRARNTVSDVLHTEGARPSAGAAPAVEPAPAAPAASAATPSATPHGPPMATGETIFVSPNGTASTDPHIGTWQRNAAAQQAAAQQSARISPTQRVVNGVRNFAQEAADATGASSIASGSGVNAAEQAATASKIANVINNNRYLNKLVPGLGIYAGGNEAVQGLREGDYTRAGLGVLDAGAAAAPLLAASVPAAAVALPAAAVYGAARVPYELTKHYVTPMLSEDTQDLIGGTINEGVRSLGKLFGKDWGMDDTNYLLQKAQQNNPVTAPARPVKPAAPKEDKAAATEQAAAAQQPLSLRDMYLNRLLNMNGGEFSGLGGKARDDERLRLIETLGTMENNANTTTASTTNAMLKARQDAQDATDKRINQMFTTPVVDKTGQVTSNTPDDAAARAFRENMVQQGINIYALPNETQDALAREFGVRYRALKNINQTLVGNGGDQAPVSDVIGAYNIQKGLGIGDVIGNEGVTFGDYLKSLRPWSNGIDNRVVRLPTGEAVSAANAFRTPEGAIDYDAYTTALNDASKMQKLIAAAKAEQAKANK